MKIMIEMSPEHYNRLLSKVSQDSMAYNTLKNGIVSGGSDKKNRIIEIACEELEAKTLLDVARDLCPEAGIEIDKGITLAKPFQK